jgi:hypothetical protein
MLLQPSLAPPSLAPTICCALPPTPPALPEQLLMRISTDYSQNTLDAAATASTATFVTAFATNAATAGVQLIAWIILRGWIKAV